ncbi:MAG: efflux RND transporter periplasmic adaptor subunit [Deltaproteobacteria bacterium]|nr:efflux RND transporter periplasmic adaptor subunit [Deltaproteobacteria bacterium]
MDRAVMNKRDSRAPWLFIIVVGVFLITSCNGNRSVDEVEFLVPVSVSEVGTADVEDRIIATGTLRASRMVSLEVETGGVLEFAENKEGKRFGEGDRVKSGDVIARITGEDIRLAARTEANLQRFETARDEYESTKKLYEEGFRSKSELLTAKSSLEEARVEYERSLNEERRSQLITPIDGVILRLGRDRENQNQPLAGGQFVKPGFEVARVAPTDHLIADVDLVGQDVARVTKDLPVRVRHYAWEDASFSGKVIRLAPTIDPTTRALRAEVEVENPDGRLRPGMFVEVAILKEQRKDVPVVPREAVTERGGKWVVFILKGQRVSMKEVVLGLGDDDIVEIRDGLAVGERVVIRGLETLTDQTRVRVTETG